MAELCNSAVCTDKRRGMEGGFFGHVWGRSKARNRVLQNATREASALCLFFVVAEPCPLPSPPPGSFFGNFFHRMICIEILCISDDPRRYFNCVINGMIPPSRSRQCVPLVLDPSQAAEVELRIRAEIHMQIDGEPWKQAPAKINIQRYGQSTCLRGRRS